MQIFYFRFRPILDQLLVMAKFLDDTAFLKWQRGSVTDQEKIVSFLYETGEPVAQQQDSTCLKKYTSFSWSVTDP